MNILVKIMVLMLFTANVVNAQHDHSNHSSNAAEHSHKANPPHGGIIKDVGKYHFEIVVNFLAINEKLSIYVFKSNLKPVISPQVFGKAKVQYIDGKEEAFDLISDTSGMLYCNPTDMTKSFNAIITVTIKGKEYSTIYTYEGFKR